MFRISILLSLLLFNKLWAQQEQKGELIQQRIEFISEQLQSENLDLTNIVEQLNYYFDNPINLNQTSAEELNELNLLTPIQIQDLLIHKQVFGKFISIYELQSLTYWDLYTIQQVLPFVRIDDRLDNLHITFKEAIKEGKFELFLRYQPTVERKAGYSELTDTLNTNSTNYLGNSDRYYSRFRYTYKNNISVGFTAEKDAGEQFFKGAQKNGFDFYSGHVFFKGGKYLKSFVIGDYQVQIGQGLGMWSSYAFGKTADISTMKRNPIPIRPYTSVDESRFLRGAALQFGFRNLTGLLFASSKMVDGSTGLDSIYDDLEFISTIDLSGLHRTEKEVARKNGFRENQAGVNLNYGFGTFRMGGSAIYQGYDKSLIKDIRPYNQFDFRGQHNFVTSFDYSFTLKNWNIFGEYAKNFNPFQDSMRGGQAHVHGIFLSLDPNASIGLLYRNYSKDYFSFYNAGFSEGSNTQNEKGVYAGLKLRLNKQWSLNSYLDIFTFPWMKYLVDAPSRGHEFLSQLTFKPSKTLELYGRYRLQLRQRNSRDSDFTVTEIEDVFQQNIRFNLAYSLNEFYTFKSRFEFVQIERPSRLREKGIIFTQDLIYKPKSFPIDLALRYALFDTDSYDTRLYSFENNAQYAFSVPAYSYQGSRAYFLIRYSLRKVDFWFRYGVFIYNNRNQISSGLEEIEGPVKSDLILQVRFSF
ncbi:MAG: hypothetical protein FJZ66_02045 [Bacteroidetes bacterium]|nr:hypothetical protein [Bacteroidota bacterium]